jgi:hypothetical protein
MRHRPAFDDDEITAFGTINGKEGVCAIYQSQTNYSREREDNQSSSPGKSPALLPNE